MKKKLKVLCYSHEGFNDIMKENEWYEHPGDGVATISICSQNDEDPYHWFEQSDNNINLDFDDFDPYSYWHKDVDYDTIFDDFINGEKDDEFDFKCNTAPTGELHAMDLNDAERLVRFIAKKVTQGYHTIYVHCSAGVSRSQGVVRYILDNLGGDVDIETNPDNPCMTPNYHVVTMLKRMDRALIAKAL